MNLTAAYKQVLIELVELRKKVYELQRDIESDRKHDVVPQVQVILKRKPGRPRKVQNGS